MRLFIIAFSIFLLSGCTTVLPPMSEYRLDSKMCPSEATNTPKGCEDKSLKVAEAFSSGTLMALNMNYVQGVNKQFSYAQAQWSVAPKDAVTQKLLELARGTNLFKSVQVSKSRSKNDLILETNIEDFMQYYSEDLRASHAKVTLTLTLIDAGKNHVLSSKTFTSKAVVKTLDAQGGVEALDRALFDVLSEINVWLGDVCK